MCAVQHGQGTCKSSSDGHFEGCWANGKPHGVGTMIHKGMGGHGDVVWHGEWEDGRRVGDAKVSFTFVLKYLEVL